MKRRPSLIPVALILLVGLAAPLPAAAGHALTGLRASEGFPVEGVPGGVLLQRELSPECALTADGPPEPAVAGPAAGSLELEVTAAGCPEDLPPATVHCTWTITRPAPESEDCRTGGSFEPLSGEATWEGWQGRLPLTMPTETGRYALAVDCQVDGSPEGGARVESELFVTLAEPRPHVSPPRPDWYRRATCWGAGFAAGTREGEPLPALLDGISRFGGRHWRYGSFSDGSEKVGNTCVLDPSRPVCDRSGWCHCCWQALAAGDPLCNYGSCYEFSEVLSGVAATLGIGGLVPVVISGADDAGFATQPGIYSLDPKFKGNVYCQLSPSRCPPYLFSSHSLRQRDGRYYDSTFNRIYQEKEEPIYRSLKKEKGNQDRLYRFVASRNIACQLGDGYGDWSYFSYPPPPGSDSSPLSLCPVAPGRPATFTGDVELIELDSNRDGHPEVLVAKVRVEVDREGRYLVRGELFAEGALVTRRPALERPGFATAVVTGVAGTHTAYLQFSGEAIARAGSRSGYELRATLFSPEGFCDALTKEVSEIQHRRFVERGATITGVEVEPGVWPREVEVDFESGLRSAHTLEGRLAAGGETLAYFGGEIVPSRGRSSSVHLPVPPLPPDLKPRGEVELTIIVYDAAGSALDSWTATLPALPEGPALPERSEPLDGPEPPDEPALGAAGERGGG